MADNETLAPPVSESTQDAPPISTPAETEAPAEVTTGAEEGVTPAPPEEAAPEKLASWSGVTDVYDLLELEELKPHLAQRDTRNQARLQQEFQERYEQATKSWEATNTHQTLNGIAGRLASKLDEGDFEGAGRMLEKLKEFREPYMESHAQGIRQTHEQVIAGHFQSLLENSLSPRDADALRQAVPGSAWPDVIKKFAALVGDGREEKGYNRGLADGKSGIAAQQQVQQAQGTGANLAPGTGGGRTDVELLLDRTTPTEKLREIRARHNAAGE